MNIYVYGILSICYFIAGESNYTFSDLKLVEVVTIRENCVTDSLNLMVSSFIILVRLRDSVYCNIFIFYN